MTRLIIADTGPIIALAKIDRLDILRDLTHNVCVPKTVARELYAKIGNEAAVIDDALNAFIYICDKPETGSKSSIYSVIKALGPGEREVIATAYYTNDPTVVVIDDKAARTTAKKLQLNVTGTIGVLIKAKQKGLLKTNFTDTLYAIRKNGYYLSNRIIELGCKIAGGKN